MPILWVSKEITFYRVEFSEIKHVDLKMKEEVIFFFENLMKKNLLKVSDWDVHLNIIFIYFL
jgi:hypothetical protein